MTRHFPDGFWWGAATAAHQVEGGNWNNDWWMWEHAEGTPCIEPSGDAVDQYHRYAADLALLADLGFDNYRFSIEWSRIEPEDGEFSVAALDHYVRVCEAARAVGLDPVVTYRHFTTPRWLANQGGWESPIVVDRFARFCERAAAHLGDRVARACTINEPNIVTFVGWVLGFFPPGKQDGQAAKQVSANFVAAHRAAYDAIKGAGFAGPVGLTLSMSDYQAEPADDPAAVAQRDEARRLMEDVFLESVRGDDFIGVQTYSRTRFGAHGMLGPEDGVPVVDIMGYEFWPEALAATIRRAWEVTGGVPVIVTESGLSATDDTQRIEYVRRALTGVLDCLDEGIDVRGYTYWSLLDNFEWAYGYGPQFGLVAVDRATQQRTAKPSARWLGGVARSNALDA
jgi:beta-glucosidase